MQKGQWKTQHTSLLSLWRVQKGPALPVRKYMVGGCPMTPLMSVSSSVNSGYG